jgi:hypothetical protein
LQQLQATVRRSSSVVRLARKKGKEKKNCAGSKTLPACSLGNRLWKGSRKNKKGEIGSWT